MSAIAKLSVMLSVVLLLTSCGQKGPLFLPEQPQAATETTNQAATDQDEEDQQSE